MILLSPLIEELRDRGVRKRCPFYLDSVNACERVEKMVQQLLH